MSECVLGGQGEPRGQGSEVLQPGCNQQHGSDPRRHLEPLPVAHRLIMDSATWLLAAVALAVLISLVLLAVTCVRCRDRGPMSEKMSLLALDQSLGWLLQLTACPLSPQGPSRRPTLPRSKSAHVAPQNVRSPSRSPDTPPPTHVPFCFSRLQPGPPILESLFSVSVYGTRSKVKRSPPPGWPTAARP